MQKISILVPAYNEESTIGTILDKLLALPFSNCEIIVVDDGSQDKTVEIVREYASKSPHIRLLVSPRNAGKTAAIARAISESSGDVLIVPSRVLYYYHYLANKFLTCLSNILTNRNMSDIETCYKAFRSEVIVPLRLTSHGFGMEVEITAMVCKTRARTYEVPISYYGRTYEEGKKIGVWDGVAAIWYILYYNLIQPWTKEGTEYIRTVNTSLKSRSSSEKS